MKKDLSPKKTRPLKKLMLQIIKLHTPLNFQKKKKYLRLPNAQFINY